VPSSIRPGDVLADRYRLVDLLTESAGGRFWRAHDRILERHVALHVIAADDVRAAGLLEAARRSATVHDRRLLRVLDADQYDDLCFVVNEWGSGDSLDIMLANEGPLDPRRAAWLVSEVAASIAAGHDAGVAHGRLVPENVLVDHAGAVRLIGFAVDAAMHGLPPGRVSTDVADLGGLLYSALTGKWAGVSSSDIPPAPTETGRVLRPRRVRAGIPRPLDSLCDEVINPYAGQSGARLREAHDLATATGICDYLSTFVGDPTGLAEAEAAAGHRDTEIVALPTIADPPAPQPTPQPEPEANSDAETEPAEDEPASPVGSPTNVER
jgi:serine/threonine protein kinase